MLNNVEYQIKAFEILQNVFVKYSKCESDYRCIRDSMAELEEYYESSSYYC